jgi:hypothetical protein
MSNNIIFALMYHSHKLLDLINSIFCSSYYPNTDTHTHTYIYIMDTITTTWLRLIYYSYNQLFNILSDVYIKFYTLSESLPVKYSTVL